MTAPDTSISDRWLLAPGRSTLLLAAGVLLAAPALAQPVFTTRVGDLFGLIDVQGKVLLPAEYTEIKLGEPLILVRKGQRTAFVDTTGRMVIAPQDRLQTVFTDGLAPAPGRDAEGRMRWGYVDTQGRDVIASAFERAEPFVDGLAVISVADVWGVSKFGAIDRHGGLVLPAVHDKLLAPAGGQVRSESRQRTHRVFNAQGRDITPAGIDFVGIPAEGMVRVWSARLQGFMSAPRPAGAGRPPRGSRKVAKPHFLESLAGELKIAPRFEQASDFREGRARVWIAGKYGFIDAKGELVVPAQYDTAEDFSDGLALVRQGGRSLFITPHGQVALQPDVDRAWSFTQGLAAVRVAGKHGFIDKQGRLAIAAQFSFARPFHQGLAYVGQGRESGYIRPDGSFVWRGP